MRHSIVCLTWMFLAAGCSPAGDGGNTSPQSGSGGSSSDVNTRVSTSGSNVQDDSESKAEAKAKMTGFVEVKFKSETFPLERMASQVEVQQMQEKSAR